MEFLIRDGMEPDQVRLQLRYQVIIVLLLLKMTYLLQFLVYLEKRWRGNVLNVVLKG